MVNLQGYPLLLNSQVDEIHILTPDRLLTINKMAQHSVSLDNLGVVWDHFQSIKTPTNRILSTINTENLIITDNKHFSHKSNRAMMPRLK